MPCEPMSSTATNAKSAKCSDGGSSVGPLGSTTGCPVSLRHGGLVWPLTPEGNGTPETVGSVATGDRDEADGQPRAYEYEPGYDRETDAERAAYLIVTAVLWGLSGWAFLAACWAAAGLIAG